MIYGFQIGSTNLVIWEQGVPHNYDIEVTADGTALETQLRTLFPGADINVSTSGGAVILTGAVQNPTIARRAAALAAQTGRAGHQQPPGPIRRTGPAARPLRGGAANGRLESRSGPGRQQRGRAGPGVRRGLDGEDRDAVRRA